ncbi:MAG: GH3 auxin-responsive promoter family protein [Saprospiraceae bacterium]|nr:GH3 auxin-responsive promoter family protein [Saprospiraceae bacterium]
MGIKAKIILPVAKWTARNIKRWASNAVKDQDEIMYHLVDKAKKTKFGRDHRFNDIKSYEDFKQHIPVKDYEGIRSYVDLIIAGEKDVLWPGVPKYFAKTSGTTSGVKYIPLTHDSMSNHLNPARNAMLNYIAESNNSSVFDGKMIFLSGSPELSQKGGIKTGRLSGIVNHEIPIWLKGNQLPSFETNCIDEWEEKLEKIVDETLHNDMRLIGGIPPWVQMYYERLLERTGKASIKEIFPNYNLFMYGGVNFEPYRAQLEGLIGESIPSVELYPASEGFIAFQVSQNEKGLLLNTRSGIFYEFIPVQEAHNENPTRLKLDQVELDKDYALVINNNAGLWGYSIGDCVRFVSLDPYKIIVSGRIKHYISAFGEHVIGKEVEEALMTVVKRKGLKVVEFTVAPEVNPSDGSTPYHEWFVEFEHVPENLLEFSKEVDLEMVRQNIYYEDLIKGNILQTLKIRPLQAGAFREYMKDQGKLGGQNKVPRLSNDRKIADFLVKYIK